MRILAMPAYLEIQRGVEVPGVIMNLPQGSGMDDDEERWASSSSLNGFANRRGNRQASNCAQKLHWKHRLTGDGWRDECRARSP